jgi:hypothetical protein
MDKKPTVEEITRRRKKTISVKHLAEKIKGLRQRLTKDIKSLDEKISLTATAIAIMDCTAERVGNDTSAGNGHFGVTGFKKCHIDIHGESVTLKYVGKSGVEHEKQFKNQNIATILKKSLKRCKSDNDFVFVTSDGFKIKSDRINRYLEEYGITAKDIRGYAANHKVIESLKGRNKSSDEKERKKVMSEILQKVADDVGHGKATLRKHYLLPNIENDYVKKGIIPTLKQASLPRLSDKVAHSFYNEVLIREYVYQEKLSSLENDLKVMKQSIRKKYFYLFEEFDDMPNDIRLEVGSLPEGKIASYKYHGENSFGLLTLSSKVLDLNRKMIYIILAHELIHAALGNTKESENHGNKFQILATELGIPKKFQD